MSSLENTLRQTFKSIAKSLDAAIESLDSTLNTTERKTQQAGRTVKQDPTTSWEDHLNITTRGIKPKEYCKLYAATKSVSDSLKTRISFMALGLTGSKPDPQRLKEYNSHKTYEKELDKLVAILEALCALQKTKAEMCKLVEDYGGTCD